jgi:hypothetical protein
MTTLGWSAFGSLITKILAQSNSLSEALCYTNVAIAVCAVVAALLAIKGLMQHQKRRAETEETPQNFRVLAAQARFVDTRTRFLGLAERFS